MSQITETIHTTQKELYVKLIMALYKLIARSFVPTINIVHILIIVVTFINIPFLTNYM